MVIDFSHNLLFLLLSNKANMVHLRKHGAVTKMQLLATSTPRFYNQPGGSRFSGT